VDYGIILKRTAAQKGIFTDDYFFTSFGEIEGCILFYDRPLAERAVLVSKSPWS